MTNISKHKTLLPLKLYAVIQTSCAVKAYDFAIGVRKQIQVCKFTMTKIYYKSIWFDTNN